MGYIKLFTKGLLREAIWKLISKFSIWNLKYKYMVWHGVICSVHQYFMGILNTETEMKEIGTTER